MYSSVLYYIILYCITLQYITLYDIVVCCITLCCLFYVILYFIFYHILLYHTMSRYVMFSCIILICVTLYHLVSYSTTVRCIMLYHAMIRHIVLSCIALCYIISSCIILYYILYCFHLLLAHSISECVYFVLHTILYPTPIYFEHPACQVQQTFGRFCPTAPPTFHDCSQHSRQESKADIKIPGHVLALKWLPGPQKKLVKRMISEGAG